MYVSMYIYDYIYNKLYYILEHFDKVSSQLLGYIVVVVVGYLRRNGKGNLSCQPINSSCTSKKCTNIKAK